MLLVLKRGRRYVDHSHKDGTSYVTKEEASESGRGLCQCLKDAWLKS